jgi:hypothetical protein
MSFFTVKPKSYLKLLLLCACGALAAMVGFSYLVDPYSFFGSVSRPGFNLVKPKPSVFQEEVRLSLAIRRQPTILILGNSRVEAGFNPSGTVATGLKVPVQLLAIPGNTLAKTLPSLIALGRKAPIKTVLVGLDFQDYVTARDVMEDSLRASKLDKIVLPEIAELKWNSLLRIDTVMDAVKTVRIQRQAFPETLAASGFNPSLDYVQHVAQIGHHGLFQHSLASLRAKTDKANRKKDIKEFQANSPRFKELALIIELAKQNNWNLELFFFPVHSEALALYEAEGFGDLIVEWKRKVLAVVESGRSSSAGIRLWDFSCPSEITSELIPRKGDHQTKMKYYWESGHFKESVGDLILTQIFEGKPIKALGSNVNPLSIQDAETRFAQCREATKAYPRDSGLGS